MTISPDRATGYYCPTSASKKRRHSRWISEEALLFPGCLFVQTAFGHDGAAPIHSTQGCGDLLRFGDHNPLVPALVLEALMDQAAPMTMGGG